MILTNEVFGQQQAEKLVGITSGLLQRGMDELTTRTVIKTMITDKNNQYSYDIWDFKASNNPLKELLRTEGDQRPRNASSVIVDELMEEATEAIDLEENEEEKEMINNTTIKVPKKYQTMIELVEKDGDGYWAYAKEGYIFAGMGCGTAHEYTQKELLEMIRTLKAE